MSVRAVGTSRRPWGARRLAVALLAGAVLAVSAAGGAHAADGAIVNVERGDEGLEVSVDVPADVEVDLDGVTATVGGVEYPAEAFRISEGDSRVGRTTVLAIDTSASMSGARFAAAQAAAATFLDVVPADVKVGIVGFDSDVDTLLAPTTDRDEARAVVATLALDRGTRLYDGVLAAVQLAAQDDQGSVLVLSDGADTGSTSLDDVVATLDGSEVVVDVVALEQDAGAVTTLRRLTGQAGEVVSADSAELSAAFSAEAAVLARQVGVSIAVPAELAAQQIDVAVSLPSASGDVVARSTVLPADGASEPTGPPTLAVPVQAPPSRSFAVPGWTMYAGVGVFGVGLVLALLLLVPAKPRPMTTEERVATYTTGLGGGRYQSAEGARTDAGEATLTQANQAVASLLQRNRGLDDRIAARLAAAGSELKSSEWLLTHAAVFVVVSLVGLLLGGGNLVLGLLFMLGGAVGPWIYLGIRAGRRRKKFDSLLPETLQLMSGSLSAGLSLMQSVDTIVREGAEPVRSEFKRVLVETRLGVTLEDAMDGVADRFESRDFRWVVMAIRIQREVGGNLGELLNTVADTMREREYIRRQVNALAAEGKLSAIVLGALPVLFFFYLVLAQGDYARPLYDDPRGIILTVGAALWLGVGVFWMSKLIKVEV